MADGRALLRLIEAERAALLELLGELVAIPSHASQPSGIVEVGRRVGAELAALGFELHPTPPPRAARRVPGWAETVLSPEAGFDDLLDPIVWRRPGASSGTLLLLGDLDVALALDPVACRIEVRGERAVGLGVADMKGGLVVMIGALRALAAVGVPAPAVTVVLSGDEQAGSLRSGPIIAALGETASWCICLECARDGGRLMRSRGHIGVGLLRASGVEAHAGSARREGSNAISALAAGLVALEAPGVSTADASVTATILSGGRRRSLVPAAARAVLDVRARDAGGWSALESRMRAALAGLAAAEQLELETFNHRPGLPATERTEWLLARVREAGAKIGVQVAAIDSMAAGSSAFVDSRRIPVIDGMGPAGGALMTADEYVEVDSIASRAALLAGTIAGLSGPGAGLRSGGIG